MWLIRTSFAICSFESTGSFDLVDLAFVSSSNRVVIPVNKKRTVPLLHECSFIHSASQPVSQSGQCLLCLSFAAECVVFSRRCCRCSSYSRRPSLQRSPIGCSPIATFPFAVCLTVYDGFRGRREIANVFVRRLISTRGPPCVALDNERMFNLRHGINVSVVYLGRSMICERKMSARTCWCLA